VASAVAAAAAAVVAVQSVKAVLARALNSRPFFVKLFFLMRVCISARRASKNFIEQYNRSLGKSGVGVGGIRPVIR